MLNATPLTPQSSSNNLKLMSSNVNQTSSQLQLGSTWTNAGLNIDVDNLTISGNRNKSGSGPSMNQLATNSPTSPIGRQGLGLSFGNVTPVAQSNTVMSPTMSMMGGLLGTVPSSAPGTVPSCLPGVTAASPVAPMGQMPHMAQLGLMQPNTMPTNPGFFPATFK